MTRMSISDCWDESRAFLLRESRLLAPLALALLFLPRVVTRMAEFGEQSQKDPSPTYLLLFFAQVLISAVGQLSISRLALGFRDQLGETIRHSVRRLPPYVGALAIFAVPLSLAFVVLVSASEVAKKSGNQGLALVVLTGLIALMVGVLVVFTRALFVTAVASVEQGSAIAVLRRSFALSRGHALRMLGAAMLFLIGGGLAILALSFAFGTVVTLLLGQPEPWTVPALLIALADAACETVLALVFTVFFARLYALRVVDPGVPSSGT